MMMFANASVRAFAHFFLDPYSLSLAKLLSVKHARLCKHSLLVSTFYSRNNVVSNILTL